MSEVVKKRGRRPNGDTYKALDEIKGKLDGITPSDSASRNGLAKRLDYLDDNQWAKIRFLLRSPYLKQKLERGENGAPKRYDQDIFENGTLVHRKGELIVYEIPNPHYIGYDPIPVHYNEVDDFVETIIEASDELSFSARARPCNALINPRFAGDWRVEKHGIRKEIREIGSNKAKIRARQTLSDAERKAGDLQETQKVQTNGKSKE